MLLQKIYSDKTYVAWRVTKFIQQGYMFSENEGPSPSMCDSARAPCDTTKSSWLECTTHNVMLRKSVLQYFMLLENIQRNALGSHMVWNTLVSRPL
jgi:hypothetical protein